MSSKIKVTLDARMLHHSGIGTYVKNLLPALASNTKLTCIGTKELSGYIKSDDSIEIVDLPADIYSIKEQIQLPKLVGQSDLFWSPHYNIPIGPVKSKKRLVTIHDVFHLAFYDQLSLKQKIYAKVVLNLAVKMSDCIITVSEFSKKEIIKYTNADASKITVIYNGVDTDKFRPVHPAEIKERVRDQYNLPEHFILYTGNVKPHKNLVRLLEAFRLVIANEEFKTYKLLICGKYEGFITGLTNINELIDNLGLKDNVIMPGYISDDDLPVVYNLASIFVFPSLYEGFGLPPLEAMASNCAVLVANSASLPEVCGDAAAYIDPLDVDSIFKGIMNMLENSVLREQLKSKGLERVKKFLWQDSIQQHLKLIDNLISK